MTYTTTQEINDSYRNLDKYVTEEAHQKKIKEQLNKEVFGGKEKRYKTTITTLRKEGVQGQIESAPNVPGVRGMYDFKLTKESDADDFKLEYVYGTTMANQVVRGQQFQWGVSARKKIMWKVLESEFAKEISPISKDKIKKRLQSLASGLQELTEQERKILASDAVSAIVGFGQAATLMGFNSSGENIIGTTPEVIVGGVPLYSVQYIERAKSDRKLKSRAIGDVFLAHQKGNKDVLRVDLTLSGIYRYVYLWYLITLQKEGSSTIKNVNESTLNKIDTAVQSVQEGSKTENNLLNYEVHNTFPVITRNHILLNMYLQTIEWHQSVEDGRNVIKVHLLFRKYFPTTAFVVFNPIKDDEDKLIGGPKMGLKEQFGHAKRWMEYTIDTIWKMMRLKGEIYGRMLIGDDGQETHIIDQQAVSSMDKLVTSYSGKFLGII